MRWIKESRWLCRSLIYWHCFLLLFSLADVPLSYGLIDVRLDPNKLNAAEFIWDPTKETGVYIRVHCISTEFTPKKHGGEKGVPFRIQVESHTSGEGDSKLLHCASCQVKVFKVCSLKNWLNYIEFLIGQVKNFNFWHFQLTPL